MSDYKPTGTISILHDPLLHETQFPNFLSVLPIFSSPSTPHTNTLLLLTIITMQSTTASAKTVNPTVVSVPANLPKARSTPLRLASRVVAPAALLVESNTSQPRTMV